MAESNAKLLDIASVAPERILLIPDTATLFNSGLVLLLVLSAVNMSSHILSNSVAVTLLNLTTFFF